MHNILTFSSFTEETQRYKIVHTSKNNLKMKLVLLTFVLVAHVLNPSMADSSFCDKKCGERCSKAGVMDRCLKYCGICCDECKCVPSGTYGNKHECPCYRDKISSKGKPKCP